MGFPEEMLNIWTFENLPTDWILKRKAPVPVQKSRVYQTEGIEGSSAQLNKSHQRIRGMNWRRT